MMAWKEETAMSNKMRFVQLALEKKTTFSKLCKEFSISRECGYKWLRRHKNEGDKGLEERSRKPHSSPLKTSSELEKRILDVRWKYPAWGAKKINAHLTRLGLKVPNPSTITRILHRNNLIEEEASLKHKAFTRFEYALPNELWQMDFKGHFAVDSGRCHPLTILDDHSRYSLDIRACANEQMRTVQEALINVFREYGLPQKMTMDNGPPWGVAGESHGFTSLEIWLMRLNIYVSHSRPCHPQTQGKDERFHRSLKEELLNRKQFKNLEDSQKHFDEWRWHYNNERPHEALKMASPASKYQNSIRCYPEEMPSIDYDDGSVVRKVNNVGEIYYLGQRYFISEGMKGLLVKIIESGRDGILEVYLSKQKVREIDLVNKVAAKKII
jgi:transposase InsO family protein